MANRELTYEDLMQLVELIKSTSHFSEFRLRVGDIEVSLRRTDVAVRGAVPRQPALPAEAPATSSGPVASSSAKTKDRQFPAGAHVVRAPMVGTFYRAPAPDQPPFAAVGQAVEPDSTVCIIEVMKLMNSIEAGVRGVVKEILVENAGPVEYGSVLMVIEPRR